MTKGDYTQKVAVFGATTVFGALLTRKLLEEGVYRSSWYIINYYDEAHYFVLLHCLLLPPLFLVSMYIPGYHVNGIIKSAKMEHHHFLHEGTVT